MVFNRYCKFFNIYFSNKTVTKGLNHEKRLHLIQKYIKTLAIQFDQPIHLCGLSLWGHKLFQLKLSYSANQFCKYTGLRPKELKFQLQSVAQAHKPQLVPLRGAGSAPLNELRQDRKQKNKPSTNKMNIFIYLNRKRINQKRRHNLYKWAPMQVLFIHKSLYFPTCGDFDPVMGYQDWEFILFLIDKF